jgi:hypothetical protein
MLHRLCNFLIETLLCGLLIETLGRDFLIETLGLPRNFLIEFIILRLVLY